jgi:predicted transcriptional regulator
MEIEIGKHAGSVWASLHGAEKPLSSTEIVKVTGLKSADVQLALGWLSREAKLEYDTSKKTTKYTLRASL